MQWTAYIVTRLLMSAQQMLHEALHSWQQMLLPDSLDMHTLTGPPLTCFHVCSSHGLHFHQQRSSDPLLIGGLKLDPIKCQCNGTMSIPSLPQPARRVAAALEFSHSFAFQNYGAGCNHKATQLSLQQPLEACRILSRPFALFTSL